MVLITLFIVYKLRIHEYMHNTVCTCTVHPYIHIWAWLVILFYNDNSGASTYVDYRNKMT